MRNLTTPQVPAKTCASLAVCLVQLVLLISIGISAGTMISCVGSDMETELTREIGGDEEWGIGDFVFNYYSPPR